MVRSDGCASFFMHISPGNWKYAQKQLLRCELCSKVRPQSVSCSVWKAITALKKGAQLLKYGRRGKPKFCPFRLSNVSANSWHVLSATASAWLCEEDSRGKCRFSSPCLFSAWHLVLFIRVHDQLTVYTRSLQFQMVFFQWVDAMAFQFSSIIV
jgi:hypothetical protein